MNDSLRSALENGYNLMQSGNAARAENQFLAALEQDPENVHALNLLGMLYVNNFRPEDAILCINKALKHAPNNAESHANLGLAHTYQGQLDKAVEHFRRSIRLAPDNPMTYNNLGNVLREQGKPRDAIREYERALGMKPDFGMCWSNFAAALNEAEQRKAAHRAVHRAIELEPDLAQAHNNRGDILLAEARYKEALESYETAARLSPKYTTAMINMARVQRDMDSPDAALATLNRVLEIEPENPQARHVLGVLREQMGDKSKAAEAFQAAIDAAPGMGVAHYHLAQIRGRQSSDEELEAMREQWDKGGMRDHDRMYFAFALARVYEEREAYDESYRFIAEGNAIKARMLPYDDEDTGRFLDGLVKSASGLKATVPGPQGFPDPRPVFVLGMPRSGTSLTEQVLASHSDVAGAGELSYAYDMAHRVRDITGQAFPENVKLLTAEQLRGLGEYYLSRHQPKNLAAAHVVDKTPLNFQYIGLLGLALPGARFIHCYREPVQNCFSIHRLPFDKKQAYAHSQDSLGLYYNRYWRLMQSWKQMFPGRILDVRYEDTVEDIEAQSRRMLEFLDLSFEPGVLEFYKSRRLVKTPSASQVRQPIYQDALQSWRRYEKHLGPLINALDWDLLDYQRPAVGH